MSRITASYTSSSAADAAFSSGRRCRECSRYARATHNAEIASAVYQRRCADLTVPSASWEDLVRRTLGPLNKFGFCTRRERCLEPISVVSLSACNDALHESQP